MHYYSFIRPACGARRLLSLVAIVTLPACTHHNVPLAQLVHAHAHNDYRHTHPLTDALDNGFTSVEADVHLIDGQLLVAHDRDEAESEVGSPTRTLQTLYLDPLLKRAHANHGRIYPNLPTLFLWIDIKSNPAAATYAALVDTFKKYPTLITTWDARGEHQRAVTVIITGNHTHALVAHTTPRYAASDGTLPDLDNPNLPADLCPIISTQWKKSFTWRGTGPFPAPERALLHNLVQKAHAQRRLIRFWDAPDNAAAWTELRAAGVDLINTDNLPGLRKFILK